MRVLLVEDEQKVADFVRAALEEQGFTVDLQTKGDDAYASARTEEYDVILLDIMLPGRDGLSILRQLREQGYDVPVILLTARGEPNERIEGLQLGADDYISKPFYVEEVIARIHAVTRRTSGNSVSVLRAGDLTVNLLSREVSLGGEETDLTRREFSVLEHLMRSRGRVLTRTQMLEHIWGYDFDPDSNVVDVYVRRVRNKIDPDGDRGFIETVRGVGYRFREETGG
ncbi:MAG: response regulator transcription factor [Armatimonadota bacterium]|jgi:two-component system OmpR family response regulator